MTTADKLAEALDPAIVQRPRNIGTLPRTFRCGYATAEEILTEWIVDRIVMEDGLFIEDQKLGSFSKGFHQLVLRFGDRYRICTL